MSSISFEDCRIFYTRRGEGKPVLLGHSYLWDSDMWKGVVEELSETYCCICVDLPGHGKSGALKGISLQKFSDIHKSVMLNEGFGEFSLVALSIGGMWGSLLALDKEVTVEKFVILNSSLTPEPLEKKMRYLGMLSVLEQTSTIPDQIIDQIAPGFFSEQRVGEFVETYKNYLKNIKSDQIPTIAEVGRCFVERGDLLEGFSEYVGPLLVVAGEYDLYRTVSESSKIVEKMDCDYVLVPTGHISAVEEVGRVAEIIFKFLS